MWPFNKKQETTVVAVAEPEAPAKPETKKPEIVCPPFGTQVAVAEPEAPAKPETKKPEIVCPPFGTQVAGLTRFGNTWMNLSEVIVIEFNPPDGCGAECYFKNQQGDWHIPDEDALAIRTYLESFEQIGKQIDLAQTD